MLFISYTIISPSLFLVLNNIQSKQWKSYFLIWSNIYGDVINFEVWGLMKNKKSKYLQNEIIIPSNAKCCSLDIKGYIFEKKQSFSLGSLSR